MSHQSNISFQSDGRTLAGRVTAPNTTGKYPGVLCLHGAGKSDKDRYEFLQNYLTDHGYATMAFDFRGCGDSEGDFEDGSLTNRLIDAKNAYNFFSKHITYNIQPITIIASSMGGHIACRLLEHIPTPQSVILLYPAAYGEQTEHLPLDERFTQAIRAEDSWKKSPAFTALAKFSGKKLLIYGEYDEVIPKEVLDRYTKIVHTNGKNLVIPSSSHTLLKTETKDQKRTLEYIAEEITKFLKP